MKKVFKTQINEGSKWVAFKQEKDKCIDRYNLHFFTSCNDAQQFCNSASSIQFQFQYKSVESVLQQWADNHPRIAVRSEELYDAFKKCAIDFMLKHPYDNEMAKMTRGELVPVGYQKDFIPRKEIGSCCIVELSKRPAPHQEPAIIRQSLDPDKAQHIYFDEIKTADNDGIRREHQLLLIGEFKNCSLQLEYDATPVNNTGMLLRMASPIFNEFGTVSHRDYKTLYELDEPAFLFQSLFVKYDAQNHALTFLNDKLERVDDPMKIWSTIDVKSFDSEPVIMIKGAAIHKEQTHVPPDTGLNKNISRDEKLNSEQIKENQSHKSRHYLK